MYAFQIPYIVLDIHVLDMIYNCDIYFSGIFSAVHPTENPVQTLQQEPAVFHSQARYQSIRYLFYVPLH